MSIKQVSARFFRTGTGSEPVREWLKKDLSPSERKEVGSDIATIEFGWLIGMPLCRSLGGGLWEIRSRLPNRIARVIFTLHDGEAVLLHGFIKKTRATPKADLDLAVSRMKELK